MSKGFFLKCPLTRRLRGKQAPNLPMHNPNHPLSNHPLILLLRSSQDCKAYKGFSPRYLETAKYVSNVSLAALAPVHSEKMLML